MTAPRSAVVTGASRGIGLAIAQSLAGRGMRVAMVARTEAPLRNAATAIGDRAIAIPGDVTDPVALDSLVDQVTAAFPGGPDVLVNNAGLFALAPVGETSVSDFTDALHANLVAPFRLLRAFLPAMRERGQGHVVTIGSIADRVALPGNAAYAASKYGVRGLHEVLRAELAGTGVRATLISPGPVNTALWNAIDPDNRPGFPKRASMLSAPSVADAVAYAILQPADVNIDELRLSRS